MKTLNDARRLLLNIIDDWEEFFEKHQNDEDFDTEEEKDDIETLNYILDVVYHTMEQEKEKGGDRLDKLLDKFENDCRTMHSIACVLVSLSTMEQHLENMGEWSAAGRCNAIQHTYLG